MAQLRAKQIRLNAPGDLLVGATNGNGSVLTFPAAPAAGTVLRAGASSLEYGTLTGSEIGLAAISGLTASTVQAGIAELFGEIGDLGNELDTTQTSIGLDTNGTLPEDIFDDLNFISDASTSVIGALISLDANVQTAIQGLGSGAIADIQAELDRTQLTVGTATNGGRVLYANEFFISNGDGIDPGELGTPIDSHHTAIGKLDAAIEAQRIARVNADNDLQSELNATQTGAGLAQTGAYVPHGDTVPYIGDDGVGGPFTTFATSLHDADRILALRIQDANEGLSELSVSFGTVIENIIDSTGLTFDDEDPDASGLLPFYSSGNFIVQGSALVPEDGPNPEIPAVDPDSHHVAIGKLDAALGDLSDDVAQLAGFDTLKFKGTVAGDITAGDFATLTATYSVGSVLRITGTGAADFAETGLSVLVGDFVALAENDPNNVWVKFDNTDPTITTKAGSSIVVDPTPTGVELSITKTNLESANNAITVTGGTGKLVGNAAASITFNPGNVNFADLAQTGAPGAGQANRYLRWTGTGIEYVDLDLDPANLGVTVNVEEDVVVGAAPAQTGYDFTLDSLPVGDIAVYINGIKLRTTGYSLDEDEVTLNEAVIGYSVEEGDVISVSYATLVTTP